MIRIIVGVITVTRAVRVGDCVVQNVIFSRKRRTAAITQQTVTGDGRVIFVRL